jgi:hypothetical protein
LCHNRGPRWLTMQSDRCSLLQALLPLHCSLQVFIARSGQHQAPVPQHNMAKSQAAIILVGLRAMSHALEGCTTLQARPAKAAAGEMQRYAAEPSEVMTTV